MYLISLNLKFETRVLDIAYLLMLKLMKEPDYSIDKKFVLLYVKVLQKQNKFKDAAAFMERNADHFKDKAERQKIEAEIFLQMKNYVMCIETYFGMLRLNSHIKHFVNMWTEYRQAICIVCNEYVFNHVGLDFKIEYERPIGKGDYKGVNFDPVQLDAVPEDILVNLFCSVYNLRQDLVTDHTQREIMEQAAEIQRTSYNAELEYKYVLALNYKQYPTGPDSSFFKTMQEFVNKFVDSCDVVGDIRKYLELLSEDDASIIRGTIKTKMETAEKDFEN